MVSINGYIFLLTDTGSSSDTGSTITPSLDAELYKAVASYEAQEDGQISFDEEQLIHVIDKMEDGELTKLTTILIHSYYLSPVKVGGL